MKKSIIVDFSSGTPSSTYSVATGYSIGSEFVNTNNGNRFYHKTDGNWIPLNNSTFYEQGGSTYSFDTTSSVYRTGNIGIGLTTPSTKLHVYSTQSGAFRLVDGTQGIGKILTSDVNGVASWTSSTSPTSTFYNLGGTVSATDTTMSIYRTGSINIGTGTSSNSRFVVSSSGGTISLVVDENGSVYNISRGISNTLFGNLSLLNNDIGNYNTAIGNGSLYSNISGSYNTSIGEVTLYYNETGDENTAVGYSSLISNTTGYQNTAIGYLSLGSNTTGDGNTTIGYSSLSSNTTGIQNIAIGGYSLLANTTGLYNIAIGYSSLYSSTQSSGNLAIGYASLYSNTSGNSNSAIGYQALNLNTIGSNNTSIGLNSMNFNTTGSDNISLGCYSGNKDIGMNYVSNSNSSIFIGVNTKPQFDNQSNQTVIGYGATGNGSNTVTLGNNDIVRTYLKGIINIGTQSTTATSSVDSLIINTDGDLQKRKIDLQIYRTISNNTSLDDTYHAAIIWVTSTCNITIPSGLRTDFNCSLKTFTGVTASYLTSGTTINSESDGTIQSNKSMAYVAQYTTDNYIISGGSMS